LPAVGVQSIAVSLFVCLSISVSLSVHSHISKTTCPSCTKSSVHVICVTWIGPHLTIVQYVMYFGFVDDLMFPHNGANGPEPKMMHMLCWVCQVAAQGWSCCLWFQAYSFMQK